MDQSRFFAFDAAFTVTYIALSAALAILAAVLVSFHMFNVTFTSLHWSAVGLNAAGALMLPFVPKLYRRVTGVTYEFTSGPTAAADQG